MYWYVFGIRKGKERSRSSRENENIDAKENPGE
jgi:hypothetical protein